MRYRITVRAGKVSEWMERRCEVQPLRHLRSRSMPPSLAGEALAFRHVFQQVPISFSENETSLPRAPLVGKTPPAGGGGTQVPKGERLSSGCETERLDKGRLWIERRTQVLLCTTSPSSSLRSMPPLLAGEALAFRDVFQQTQISFIENETSLPRAPLLGELARQRLRGQARRNYSSGVAIR